MSNVDKAASILCGCVNRLHRLQFFPRAPAISQTKHWQTSMLKSLVIIPNLRTKEIGDLLAVARAEARKREHAEKNPPIRALVFVPELQVYCAIYEAQDRDVQKPGVGERLASA